MNYNAYFGVIYTGRPVPTTLSDDHKPVEVSLKFDDDFNRVSTNTAIGYWSECEVKFMASIDGNPEEEITI
jgi:hypothetical protein